LKQLGTLEEVYYQPRSRFVAEFVTQANFFPGTITADFLSTEIGNFKLPQTNSSIQEIAIAPDQVKLNPVTNGRLSIVNRRFIGREYQYFLKTNSGKVFSVRIATDSILSIGTTVDLTINNDSANFF
jgi:iron(III) transport system ATP-binding protein